MNYGIFGGQYIPEKLLPQLETIETSFNDAIKDDKFLAEFNYYLCDYVGRPSPLYYAENFSKYLKGARIYLKREDLNHTGSHKINNALGQALLAKRMGKKHIIAETGAGQHGVAAATACALLNLRCTVFMGSEDIRKQAVNVGRMKILNAEVKEITSGTGTLKEAVDAAFEYLLDHDDVYFLIGSAVGPHPYPAMVKYFQSIIGEETREEILKKEKRLPEAIITCIGGGSNSIGMFNAFLSDNVSLYGIESAGKGIESGQHASAIANDTIGIVHGMKTYGMFDDDCNIGDAYSLASGLDYPAIGPEHAFLHKTHRVSYQTVSDEEAIAAFLLLCKTEGIIPALESAHALAYACKLAPVMTKEQLLIVNLSGRGDKDLQTINDCLKKS